MRLCYISSLARQLNPTATFLYAKHLVKYLWQTRYLNSMRTTQPSTKDRVLKMIKKNISINWNQCDQFFVERIKRHIHSPWAKKGGEKRGPCDYSELCKFWRGWLNPILGNADWQRLNLDRSFWYDMFKDNLCIFSLPSFAKSCSPDLPKMTTTKYIHSNLSYGIRLWGLLYKSIWKGL